MSNKVQSNSHMELKGLELKFRNKFLHSYNATYENKDGHKKVYEVISRDPELTIEKFKKHAVDMKSDAVGMIIFNKNKDKILLSKEWRMACGTYVYNFPGGLVDPGETVEEAAKRELKEETGLDLLYVNRVLSPSFTAIGLTNETVVTIIGIADGEFKESTSVDEEIMPGWYTKADVLGLLNANVPMALRTQSFAYLWAISN